MPVAVKICGLNSRAAIAAASGADFAGFVHYPPSPRHVDGATAAELARDLPARVKRVLLTVDLDDASLRALLKVFRPDLLQLHGKETPARADALRREHGLAIIKAVAVGEPADVAAAGEYMGVVDYLLFDARPPRRAGALPGGNALAFEWSILSGRRWSVPWLLAGGLTAENLASAVAASGAGIVDVSSGVEDRPGEKSPERIRAFLAAAARL